MENIEKLASHAAQPGKSMMNAGKISKVNDDVLPKLVTAGAVREALALFGDVSEGNEAIQLLFAESDSVKCIDLTFDDVARKVCSDDVLKRAVELLKDFS